MASAAVLRLNQSRRTFDDVRRLAEDAPAEARRYLTAVEAELRAVGKTAEATALADVLATDGSLTGQLERSRLGLVAVFPESEAHWGRVQAARAETLGYDEATAPRLLSGRLHIDDDKQLTLITDGGQQLALATSRRLELVETLLANTAAGFVGDGPVRVQGTLSESGNEFNVEGYALNTNGAFDTFTFGRVVVDGDVVSVSTARGPVLLTDPALVARLKPMPKLGVILPGAPADVGGRLRYDDNPRTFFALARFVGLPKTSDGVTQVATDMALSSFKGKPTTVPPEAVERARSNGRVWLLGELQLDGAGQPASFVSGYVSQNLDNADLKQRSHAPDADTVQAAVMIDFVSR